MQKSGNAQGGERKTNEPKQIGEYLVMGEYKIHPHYKETERCERNSGWLIKGRADAQEFKEKYFGGRNGMTIPFTCPICGAMERVIVALSSGRAMIRWWIEE